MTFLDIAVGDHFYITEGLCRKATVLSYVVVSEEVLGEIYYDPKIDAHLQTTQGYQAAEAEKRAPVAVAPVAVAPVAAVLPPAKSTTAQSKPSPKKAPVKKAVAKVVKKAPPKKKSKR